MPALVLQRSLRNAEINQERKLSPVDQRSACNNSRSLYIAILHNKNTMMNNQSSPKWSLSQVAATAILALCLITFVLVDEETYTSQYLGVGGRRSLKEVVQKEEEEVLKEK